MMLEPVPFGCLGQYSKEKEIGGQITKIARKKRPTPKKHIQAKKN
jgi:hypothetical protein